MQTEPEAAGSVAALPVKAPPGAPRRRVPGWLHEGALLAPAVVLLIVFLLLPFVLSLVMSFTNEPLIPRPRPVRFVGFLNYQRILDDPDFWQSVWNIVRFTAMVLPLQCGLALGLALLLNMKLPFRNFFRGALFIPYITSIVVVSVIWGTLYQYPSGPLNSLIHFASFGTLGPVDWLGDPDAAMISIVFLSAWQAYGFQMIIYLAGLQNVPPELYEAAKMDGAKAWTRFWHVTMPALRNTHVFVIMVTTIQAFKLFTQVAILTQGYPNGSTNTVTYYMYSLGFVEQKLGPSAAVSVLLFFMVVAVALVQRFVTRKYDA